jgi:hypothetical protein
VNVSVAGDPDLGIAGTHSLVFTPQNYSAYQSVVLVAASDADRVMGHALVMAVADSTIPSAALAREIDTDLTWQNVSRPTDVNDDGVVSAIDALIVINFINGFGSQRLTAPTPAFAPPPFWDVSGDGNVTPIDALIVINEINASSTAAKIETLWLADAETAGQPNWPSKPKSVRSLGFAGRWFNSP